MFFEREQGKALIVEIEEDEPEMAALFSVATLELEQHPNQPCRISASLSCS